MHKAVTLYIYCFVLFCPGILALSLQANAQITNNPYYRADSTGLKVKKKRNLSNYPRLAQKLTAHLPNDSAKARAIYVWVADNFRYDINTARKDLEYTVRSGKGVCWQYSDIFCRLCEHAGLPCQTVKGYAKVSLLDLGRKRTKSRHAWNRVLVNGRWEAVDVTWGSGYLDPRTKKFEKWVSAMWFFVNDSVFAATHNARPEFSEIEPLLSSDSVFIQKPLQFYYTPQPRLLFTPLSNGIISLQSAQDTLELLLRTNIPVTADSFYVQPGRSRNLYRIPPRTRDDGSLCFRIPASLPGLSRQLALYYENRMIIAYKVE